MGEHFEEVEMYSNSENRKIEALHSKNRFIYQVFSDRFNVELERTKILDGKALNIISFAGIILTLQAGFGALLLEKTQGPNLLCYLFFLGVVFIFLSIIVALKGYYFKSWNIVPNSDQFMEEYVKKDLCELALIISLYRLIVEKTKINMDNNDDKVKWIKLSFLFLVVGLSTNIIFIYCFFFCNL